MEKHILLFLTTNDNQVKTLIIWSCI